MNIFMSILTNPAPSANYRGESELNRSVIQKITKNNLDYPVISPEAMRNAMRETFHKYGIKSNRSRLNNEDQLAVKFEDYPYPEEYIDDFFFGYLVAKRNQVPEKIVKERNFQFKRDSIVRMNLALGTEAYRHDTVFTQSPKSIPSENIKWQNDNSSALLHREMAYTAYQYPIALNENDLRLDDPKYSKRFKDWTRALFKAISELNGVAGNHARSYFEMAPASIIIRRSTSLVAGYDTYGFDKNGNFAEVIDGVIAGDFPGSEIYIGGNIVKNILNEATQKKLKAKGVKLHRMAKNALDELAKDVTGKEFSGK